MRNVKGGFWDTDFIKIASYIIIGYTVLILLWLWIK